MKKTLIALAALAATGAAFAQSSVTLYGIADLVVHKDKFRFRIDNNKQRIPGNIVSTNMTSGGVSASRWGIKGTEDLGGGLKAGFVFEQKVDVSNGVANGFDRQTYLSLSGGFGEVRLGNTTTAYADVSGKTDAVFNASTLGPVQLIFESAHKPKARPTNVIRYATPSFSGFSAAVSTSLREYVSNNTKKERVSAFNVQYENGPLYVAFGYQDDKQVQQGVSIKFTRLGASYDFGAAKLLGTYGRVNKPANSDPDVSEWSIGVDVPVAANTVLSAGYARSKASGQRAESGWSVAAAYALSKRTTVYAGYFDANGAASSIDSRAGAPDYRFGVGLKHTF